MPTYTYGCDACGAEFEREQRISAAPIKKCPKCGKSKARRLIASGNFILKGSGWYADGYGSKPAATKKDASSGKSEGSFSPSSTPSSSSSSSSSSD